MKGTLVQPEGSFYYLPIPKHRLPLLDERRNAFPHILGLEHFAEVAGFGLESFRQAAVQSFVDGELGVLERLGGMPADFAGEGMGGLQPFAGLDDFIHEADFQCFGGGDRIACKNQFLCLGDADQAGQALCTARTGEQAELHLRKADFHMLLRNPDITA